MVDSTPLQKPVYTNAADIEPLTRVFCIFKCISIEAIQTAKTQLHLVKLADNSGSINMVLKEEDILQVCRDHEFLEVLNADAKIHKKFLQLEMDKWGNVRACQDEELIKKHCSDCNLAKDCSAEEYEKVEEPESKEQRGGRGRGRGGRGARANPYT